MIIFISAKQKFTKNSISLCHSAQHITDAGKLLMSQFPKKNFASIVCE